MDNPHGILVFGANGSGKTTLGRELARVLGYKHMDIEDYHFEKSEIPYTKQRSPEDCLNRMLADIEKHRAFVLSDVYGDFGEEITQYYDIAVFLSAPNDLRIERIKRRAVKQHGERVLEGGDMYEQNMAFIDFAASRPLEPIDQWAETLSCPVIRLDGTRDVAEMAAEIAARYRRMKGDESMNSMNEGGFTMSLYQSQKAVKPKVEEVAGDFVTGDHLTNLMDLLGFLKDNKLTPRWASGNSWSVKYKNKTVCYIKIIGTSWFVFHSNFTREKWFVGYEAYFPDDELRTFVWENIKGGYCPNNCMGRSRTVFGKQLNDICTCWPFRLENPDGIALERSKKVILAIKAFITDLAVANKP